MESTRTVFSMNSAGVYNPQRTSAPLSAEAQHRPFYVQDYQQPRLPPPNFLLTGQSFHPATHPVHSLPSVQTPPTHATHAVAQRRITLPPLRFDQEKPIVSTPQTPTTTHTPLPSRINFPSIQIPSSSTPSQTSSTAAANPTAPSPSAYSQSPCSILPNLPPLSYKPQGISQSLATPGAHISKIAQNDAWNDLGCSRQKDYNAVVHQERRRKKLEQQKQKRSARKSAHSLDQNPALRMTTQVDRNNRKVFVLHDNSRIIQKRYPCDRCEKDFTRKSDAKKHIRVVHERLKTFICNICNKGFARKDYLCKHLNSVHSEAKKAKKSNSSTSRKVEGKSGSVDMLHQSKVNLGVASAASTARRTDTMGLAADADRMAMNYVQTHSILQPPHPLPAPSPFTTSALQQPQNQVQVQWNFVGPRATTAAFLSQPPYIYQPTQQVTSHW